MVSNVDSLGLWACKHFHTCTATSLPFSFRVSWFPGSCRSGGAFTKWHALSLSVTIKAEILDFFLFFFVAVPCGMQNLSFPTQDKPMPSTVEAWSLNHWATREVPHFFMRASPQRLILGGEGPLLSCSLSAGFTVFLRWSLFLLLLNDPKFRLVFVLAS